MQKFRVATEEDIEPLSETLSEAFRDYPWTNWTVAPDNHQSRLAQIQELCLREIALPYGIVVTNDNHSAALAANAPNAESKVDSQTWKRLTSLLGSSQASDLVVGLPQAAVSNSWELSTVGVRPEYQGRGLGAGIIEYLIDSLDSQVNSRIPVHLETSDPRNVRLYEKLEFQVYSLTQIPSGPPVWSMQRE